MRDITRCKNRKQVASVCFMGFMALAAAGADSVVPSDWNTTPLKDGAYIETFENEYKNWMTNNTPGNELVANPLPESDVPDRANDWFSTSAKALMLNTEGAIATNKLSSGSNHFLPTDADKPAYVDVLVRFDPLDNGCAESVFEGAKMAIYASADGYLVCRDKDGSYTNNEPLARNEWNRITIKMSGAYFTVLKNDRPVSFFSAGIPKSIFAVADTGDPYRITQASFCGTGHLDDLFVGYCDPAYAVPGATTKVDVALSNLQGLSSTNITRINKWLADKKDIVTTNAVGASVDATKCAKAYLLDAASPLAAATGGADVGYLLGISAIDVLSPTQVVVTVTLNVANEAKHGAINGLLRLEGKQNVFDTAYTLLSETIISKSSFDHGSATFTFAVPSGYHIFNPVITME